MNTWDDGLVSITEGTLLNSAVSV